MHQRRSSRHGKFSLALGAGALLLLTLAATPGCSNAGRLRRTQIDLAQSIEKMRARAYRCKPKELALAESHVEFAGWELDQGDYFRARDHLRYAEPLVTEADEGSMAPYCLGDRDGDGYPDAEDQCPDNPENFNDFQDEDGCPEGDRDGDGILDPVDECPDQPEDFDGDEDEDGCPDLIDDKDGDGIVDNDDQCPLIPEDYDQFEDKDGCPEEDNDKDRLCDPWVSERGELEKFEEKCAGVDQCVNDPEDYDEFEDEDGCPDLDNDNDKIADLEDACPLEPETYNGREDEDGCPEVRIDAGKIKTDEIYFATNKTEVLPKSKSTLDEVADLLKAYPELTVRIEGHTDDRGNSRFNKKLSQGRADSVRAELIARGVDAGRLEAVGYGEDRPAVPIKDGRRKLRGDALDEARAANRRVEFVLTSSEP